MNCSLCNSQDNISCHTIGKFTLNKCVNCGFISLDNPTSETSQYYGEAYFDGHSEHSKFRADSFDAALSSGKSWLLGEKLKVSTPARILEVGPSTSGGMIKYFLDKSGYTLNAIEISEHAAATLTEKGLPTFLGTLESFTSSERYDLIIATEVIEHVAKPHLFIKKVYELLSPNGKLLLSTGNTSSLVYRLSGARWRYFDLPVHISYFNGKNLGRLLTDHGLKVYDNVYLGFSWLDILISWRLKSLLPFFRLVALPSGVFVIAGK